MVIQIQYIVNLCLRLTAHRILAKTVKGAPKTSENFLFVCFLLLLSFYTKLIWRYSFESVPVKAQK